MLGMASSGVFYLFRFDFDLRAKVDVSYVSSMSADSFPAVSSSVFDVVLSRMSISLPSFISDAAVLGFIPVVSSIDVRPALEDLPCLFMALVLV